MSIVAPAIEAEVSRIATSALPRTSAGPGPIGARVTGARRGLSETPGKPPPSARLSPGGRRVPPPGRHGIRAVTIA